MTASAHHSTDASDDNGQAGLPRLAAAQESASLLETFVGGLAPRLFALVEENDDELDGQILAWGLQFHDHASVVAYGGEMWGSFTSATSALRIVAHMGTTIRLVWCSPADTPACRTPD
ncbi:hypothetical protein [Frankia sp. Cr1]|uniref:hypothetical protein n=1 Tax=Frankia sp. Cr1 TaxID=3073931 RepID=UPI002AD418BC|nr:hypothetical protein [Frankia sp. Cr1]